MNCSVSHVILEWLKFIKVWGFFKALYNWCDRGRGRKEIHSCGVGQSCEDGACVEVTVPTLLCPSEATGTYPDCVCPGTQTYDSAMNTCVAPAPACADWGSVLRCGGANQIVNVSMTSCGNETVQAWNCGDLTYRDTPYGAECVID